MAAGHVQTRNGSNASLTAGWSLRKVQVLDRSSPVATDRKLTWHPRTKHLNGHKCRIPSQSVLFHEDAPDGCSPTTPTPSLTKPNARSYVFENNGWSRLRFLCRRPRCFRTHKRSLLRRDQPGPTEQEACSNGQEIVCKPKPS